MFPSKLVYVSAHLISLFLYQMILDFWIPLENTRRKKYSKEKKKKTKKHTHTHRYQRGLQHKRVEPEKTKEWNVWNMKEFNVRKVQQLKVQYEKVQSEKGKTWMEPNM